MIKTANRNGGDKTLIIEKDDAIPTNPHWNKGYRCEFIFIHRDNPYKETFKELLQTSIIVMGFQFGTIYEYNE